MFASVRSDLGGLTVAYSGLPEGLAYTLEFTELRRESGQGIAAARSSSRLTGRELVQPERLPDADIIIVGTSAVKAWRMPAEASLIVPMRVHFVTDIDGDAEAVTQRISKRERWQHRRNMRERKWRWDVVRDPSWFDIFYNFHYRPTMRRRHGDRERIETKGAAYECLFRKGYLFALSEDGTRVGGALCHWNPHARILTLRLLGVLDGAPHYFDSGTFKAIYHFLIAWAADNGVRQVDFQGTEPFLSKGTYQWKRRLGSRVILPPNHFGSKRLWVHVKRDTEAVRDFLTSNPVLSEPMRQGQALEAVYFHDAKRPPRLDFSAKSPGVEHTRLINLDSFLGSAKSARV